MSHVPLPLPPPSASIPSLPFYVDEYQGSTQRYSHNTTVSFPTKQQHTISLYKKRIQFLNSKLIKLKFEYNILEKISKLYWLICFNRVSKLSMEMFTDWMLAMSRAGKKSIMILMAESDDVEVELKVS